MAEDSWLQLLEPGETNRFRIFSWFAAFIFCEIYTTSCSIFFLRDSKAGETRKRARKLSRCERQFSRARARVFRSLCSS